MGMLDAQRRISRQAFFSPDRLGETITYNGRDIVALVYIGASMSRSDWNAVHTQVENANIADIALFSVCDDESDPNGVMPHEGDSIVYHGNNYSVAQIVEHDVPGSHYLVMASKDERGWR